MTEPSEDLPTLDEPATPVPPSHPVVSAARARRRVPFWAAPILAALPLWAFVYAYAVQPPPPRETDPMVIGKAIYTGKGTCASCHGAIGEGGTGQQLRDGHVLQTFPDPLAMVHWLGFGAKGGARPDRTYGDPGRAGGAMDLDELTNEMPPFADRLTPEELAAVVIYVRQGLSGGDPADDPALNAETFEADPIATGAQVTAVLELGPGGDPDLTAVPTP